MRFLAGFLLVAMLLAGGCAAGTAPHGAPAGSDSDTTGVAASEVTAAPPAIADRPVPCRRDATPARDDMMLLLARISKYAPLTHLTGAALEIEQQWLDLASAGWPENAQRWVSDPWLALDITPGKDQTYVILLTYGVYEQEHIRFMVSCNADKWQVMQYARGDAPWVEPARALQGQSGDLTPALVLELVRAVQGAKGPWYAQVTTGNLLAWGPVEAVFRARGYKPLPDPWRRALTDVTLTRLSDTQAEAKFGEGPFKIRLEKVDGLWKIADYTEGGKWVGPPDRQFPGEPGEIMVAPFGIVLGVTDGAKVREQLGPPAEVVTIDSGTVYHYRPRQIEVRLDSGNKVTAITLKTGAFLSGVRVGTPLALWEVIYGPQGGRKDGFRQRLVYTVEAGKVVAVSVMAQPR